MSRVSRIGWLLLSVAIFSVTSPALHAVTVEVQTSSRTLWVDERDFSAGFELVTTGPQWFLDALYGPASTRVARAWTGEWSLDRSGERAALGPAEVGTLSDPSGINLFSDVRSFRPSGGTSLVPTAPLADAPALSWDGGPLGNGNAWLNNQNWLGDTGPPGSSQTAQFGSAGTDTIILIDFSNIGPFFTNHGGANQIVGAIELLSGTRTIAGQNNGTLTLAAVTVNGVSNVILRNASAGQLTLQQNFGGVLQVALGEFSPDNVIVIDGSGNIAISSVIKTPGPAPGHITLTGAGTGALVLSGANTYSGGTTVTSGTLQLGSSSTGSITNGPVGTGTLLLNGGTVSSSSTTARSIANAVTFGGDVILGNGTNNGTLTFSGAGTLTGNRIVTLNSDVTYSGNIGESGGSFGITKNGTGTLILSGNNGYSGGTTANDGLLRVKSSSALGSSSGSLTVNAGTANGAIVDLSGNSIGVGNLTGSGGNIWNNLNGQNTTATLTIGTGNTGGGNYQGVISNNNGASNGIVALTKTGNGTITLSGTNTYTGATTVSGGTLVINGSTAAGSALTVNNSGTLAGNGTISGTVSLTAASGATLSPGGTTGTGNGIAVLHTGALTLNSGTTFSLDLNGGSGVNATGAGSLYDQLVVNGQLTLGGNLSVTVGATPLNVGDKYFIALSSATTVSGTFANAVGPVYTSGPYVFTINYADSAGDGTNLDDISLTVTAIPEPSTWIGAGLALGAIGVMGRKRFNKKAETLKA
jgi:fibronectin-binding autotransporter adhesin